MLTVHPSAGISQGGSARTTAASRQCVRALRRVPLSMPGGSRGKRRFEEWVSQVCWDEFRHSSLALARFHPCCSRDNFRFVATSDYTTFRLSNAPTDVLFREDANKLRGRSGARKAILGCHRSRVRTARMLVDHDFAPHHQHIDSMHRSVISEAVMGFPSPSSVPPNGPGEVPECPPSFGASSFWEAAKRPRPIIPRNRTWPGPPRPHRAYLAPLANVICP